MDTVVCPHCSRNVVPRLWHQHSNHSDRATQHICPLCGQVMYVTGGKLSMGSILVIIVVGFMLFIVGIALIREKFNPPLEIPLAVCKGSAAHCKAAAAKHK